MQRDRWSFDIPAKELAAAAEKKLTHHGDRLTFWKSAQEKVMAEVREKGLSVESSLAGENYTSNVHRYTPQIVVDEVFQRRLNEAAGKIQEHTKKVGEYEGWVQVLNANANRTYSLHADDYLFFFGTVS